MWRRKPPKSRVSSATPIVSDPAFPETAVGSVEQSLIGKGLVFKGEISGTQDLMFNGWLEGSVSLSGHTFTVGQEGRVQGDIRARVIRIEGRVDGNLQGEESVFLGPSSLVLGDVTTVRISIEEGCRLQGRVQAADEGRPASEPSESLVVCPVSAVNGQGAFTPE